MLDLEKVTKEMFAAAFAVLRERAPKLRSVVELECRKIAQTLALVEVEFVSGELSREEAALLVDMQRSATRSVLLMSQGMSLVIAERAVNGALDVARAAINTALGTRLL